MQKHMMGFTLLETTYGGIYDIYSMSERQRATIRILPDTALSLYGTYIPSNPNPSNFDLRTLQYIFFIRISQGATRICALSVVNFNERIKMGVAVFQELSLESRQIWRSGFKMTCCFAPGFNSRNNSRATDSGLEQ